MTYLNFDEVESAFIALAAAYPGIWELINLPNTTVEERTCHAILIGQCAATNRDGVFFTWSVHARERGGEQRSTSTSPPISLKLTWEELV